VAPELFDAPYFVQAEAAYKAAVARENAEHPPESKFNADGTVNLEIVANWGKRNSKDGKYEQHYSRVLTHLKRSFTIRHVMMLVNEYPDDIGLGVDLTEATIS